MPARALIPKAIVPQALSIVPYLTREEVSRLAAACHGRNRLRDELLIHTLFQTGVRISEALSLSPRRIGSQEGGAVLYILGKGGKSRLVACPASLAHRPNSLVVLGTQSGAGTNRKPSGGCEALIGPISRGIF